MSDMPTLYIEPLTHRERQMAQAVSRGLRNRQIAREFGISEETVKKHLATIYGSWPSRGGSRWPCTSSRRAHCQARPVKPVRDGGTAGRPPASPVGVWAYIDVGLMAATTRLANSPALPWCQRHTTTRS